MSSTAFPNTENVPKHIMLGIINRYLQENSKKNVAAKYVHCSQSDLASQGIDSHGQPLIKLEPTSPPPPTTLPPITERVAMAKWTHIYQQEMKDALDVVLQQAETNTAEKLLSSEYDYNIHGLLEMLRRTYAEPANGRQECLDYMGSSEDPRIFLIRLKYIMESCPMNYPTEHSQVQFAKEAAKTREEFRTSTSLFDMMHPEHRLQVFSGENGWYQWMDKRIDHIIAEAERIKQDHQVNHMANVDDLNHDIHYLSQRLSDLETNQINHVPEESKQKPKNKKVTPSNKAAYKYYCFVHGHTKNPDHISAKCRQIVPGSTFRYGKNKGKAITAAMQDATEPCTIDGVDGSTNYCTPRPK